MQRILILITKSNWGGAQRYVYDLAVSLPKESYDVEVMSGTEGVLIEKLASAGIPASGDLSIQNVIGTFADIKAFLNLFLTIRQKKPDILHLNSSKIALFGALAGRLAGIPQIIFTAHGWAFNEDRGFLQKMMLKYVHWFTLLLSHKTIAVSEALKYQVRNWPFIQDKITIIHNGITPEALFSKANARTELIKLNQNLAEMIGKIDARKLIVLGTIAELHPVKGYSFALRAVHGLIQSIKIKNPLSTVVYVIIGEGKERAGLEKTISDLGLQDNVFLMGHIGNASHYLKALDIFLLASISEGLGYVLLEAGLAGLPVVATAVGGIPEVIDDMASGILIQSRKPQEIAHALEFYITHKKVQKEYGLALRKKILDQFSLDQMISETIKIYSSTDQ